MLMLVFVEEREKVRKKATMLVFVKEGKKDRKKRRERRKLLGKLLRTPNLTFPNKHQFFLVVHSERNEEGDLEKKFWKTLPVASPSVITLLQTKITHSRLPKRLRLLSTSSIYVFVVVYEVSFIH